MPRQLARMLGKGRERQGDCSPCQARAVILAFGQIALEQTARSGSCELRLDPAIVGKQPIGFLIVACTSEMTD
jgi:hypothetical protein